MDTENKLIVAKREVGGKMDEMGKKKKKEPRYLDTGLGVPVLKVRL